MLLYLVRHAWAEEHNSTKWPDDGLRPLTKAGIKRFKRVAKLLAARDFAPQLIATSPLLRCRQTAEILAAALSGKPPIAEVEALAPESNLRALLRWSKQQQVEALAWVGHAPDIGRLLAQLIGEKGASIRFAKGAAAAVHFAQTPAIGKGELHWHVTAKILGA